MGTVNRNTLREIRDGLVADAKETEDSGLDRLVDKYVSEFIYRLESLMDETQTTFYQP